MKTVVGIGADGNVVAVLDDAAVIYETDFDGQGNVTDEVIHRAEGKGLPETA